MKNLYKLVGIISIMAVIGFSITACKDETGETCTVTITGLSPNVMYMVGCSINKINTGHDEVNSNAAGTVTASFNSNNYGDFWGKNVYIGYAPRFGVGGGDFIYSKTTYKFEGSISLNATTDF